ncbi:MULTISPECIES: NAD-dependent epimerase/dehydratase family protein [unclassified Escherichia]|nr:MULTISPECIES: NAD-dependent epimerase/dehydratase family protein [unclassified Escherichia]
MKILVAGATGCIGIHVVNTAIAMGHQPVALVSTLSNDAAKNKTFELVAE